MILYFLLSWFVLAGINFRGYCYMTFSKQASALVDNFWTTLGFPETAICIANMKGYHVCSNNIETGFRYPTIIYSSYLLNVYIVNMHGPCIFSILCVQTYVLTKKHILGTQWSFAYCSLFPKRMFLRLLFYSRNMDPGREGRAGPPIPPASTLL